ncbi:hypothetical protein Tco_1352145 [Tanacetum coccineum]
MVVLESCPKHNMVAYLTKTDGNAEFHEIIDFLARSSIHNALTVSPVVSTTFVEQFWMSAKSKIINNVRYITATVAGKPVSISEASIRKDEGEGSERPSEPQPIPSPPHPKDFGGNQGDWCDEIDYMETEDAQDVGRTRYVVHEEKESAEKEVSTEDALDIDSTKYQGLLQRRSLVTLKPLLKDSSIKTQGQEKGIEEDESDTELEYINESKKKFKMLAHNEEIARKVQEDWEAEEEVKKLAEEEANNDVLIQDFLMTSKQNLMLIDF